MEKEPDNDTVAAVVTGIILEKDKDGNAVILRIDLDIVNDIFKIIDAWKAVETYLGNNLNIKKSINNLPEITFGGVLLEFKKSIGDDVRLIPTITVNTPSEEALIKEIKECMNLK